MQKVILLKPTQKRSSNYQINRWLMHTLDAVVNLLIQPNEPVIRQRKTPAGMQWSVYNPRTQTQQTFSSKQEVVAWIETCYYNH